MSQGITRTAEHVSAGHPDKFCDQVADRILDEILDLAGEDVAKLVQIRSAVECLAKDNMLIVTGEMKMSPRVRAGLDVEALARAVWTDIGYEPRADYLMVVDHLRNQSVDIAKGTDDFGAGDQGIMVGYATAENSQMVPDEWLKAQELCWTLHRLRESGEISWLRPDCKTQVTLAAGSDEVQSVIVAAQHSEEVSHEEIVSTIMKKVVRPVVGDVPAERVAINGTGRFVIGGPTGDAGVVGRKIVVDAYGPRIAVGGGAYSGKDPTKVDRSAAYMCRHIAKSVIAHEVQGAKECTVKLAYGIGQHQPEMVTAVTDTGAEVSSWVKEKFKDLSPRHIIDYLGLFHREGWNYYSSAAYGHYGRGMFPWEKITES